MNNDLFGIYLYTSVDLDYIIENVKKILTPARLTQE